MRTVIETPAYLRAASESGLSEGERAAIVARIAAQPTAGDEIRGTGGCRKVRFAGRGRGKSGGFRVITFYSGSRHPVFLLTVFAKGERADLSAAERNALARLTKALVASYRARAVREEGP